MSRKSNKTYGNKAVGEAVRMLHNKYGYMVIELKGTLLDECICIAPDDQHYNFYFYERYLNEWSSGYGMQRFTRKMPKWLVNHLEEILKEEEKSEAWWLCSDHIEYVREAIKNFC